MSAKSMAVILFTPVLLGSLLLAGCAVGINSRPYVEKTPEEIEKTPKVKYISAAHQENRYHNPKHDNLDTKASDLTLAYGQHIYRGPRGLLTGEVQLNRQVTQASNNYSFGGFVNFQFAAIEMFYLSTGIFHRQIENEYASTGLFPFMGFGILLNHKTIVEFLKIFSPNFDLPSDITYETGQLGYDLFFETDIWGDATEDWVSQSLRMGLRFYF